MTQDGRRATVTLVLLVMGLTAGAGNVRAEGGRGGPRDGLAPTAAPGFVPAPVAPRPPSMLRPFTPGTAPSRPFVHRPFAPSVVGYPVYVPSEISLPDPYASPPPYDPVSVYPPPTAVVPATPELPPAPSVIEYPTGRYELRGDGVATPYLWVWVPNPPPAPPATSAVPPAPPAPPEPSPESHQVYRFTDEHGVVNWTDRWDSIPERYRSQAQRLPL